MTLGHFVSIVRRDHPDWPVTAIYWQARRMLQRDPVIRKAVNAGLANGRDLRERMQHGLGVWWDELEQLTPEERGFVLMHIRAEFGLKQKPQRKLEAVKDAQAEEKYEDEADALAADWRERSDRPDKRVTLVGSIRDLLKRRRA